FSFVGMRREEVNIGGQSVINVTMAEDLIGIDEVVAVGYGVQKKINLTGAVDQVSSKELTAFKSNSMGEALQGQLGNLNVATADGKPGRGASFNIRGTTSINGGGPLIVIDGVPLSSTELNNISPQDIESISVLKDAASSAIYGARASFGVILVTTKRAKEGEFSIEYNNYFGSSRAIYVPKVYNNPADYYQIIENEFNANISSPYFTNAQLDYAQQVSKDPSLPYAKLETVGGRLTLLLGGKVHNYYEEWFRTYSPEQNHHISMRGGNGRLQYFVSGDYNHEEGALIYKPDEIDRFTVRSNVNYNVTKNISFFNNTSLTRKNEDLANTYLYGFNSNVWRFIENTNPLLPETVAINGEEVLTDAGYYREFVSNKSENKIEMHDAITTFGTAIKLLGDDLKIHADASYQFRSQNKLRWYNYEIPYLSHSFNNDNVMRETYIQVPASNVYRSLWNYKRMNLNAYATYSKSFGDHNIVAMAGYNQERYDYLYTYSHHTLPMTGIPQHSLNLATGEYYTEDDDDRNASQSTFFRINYNLKDKYLLEVNGCYNMSSKFPDDKRGAFFPSVSAGWRLSEEQFFTPLRSVVDNLKLRASFGSLGNQNIGSYDYISIMSMNQSSYTLEGERVNYTGAPAPKSGNFTWETSKTVDAGIDFTMFKGRFSTSFDMYERQTENMLAIFHSLPSVFGATVPKENIASLRTRGWELSISWRDDLKLANKPLTYGIRINVSDAKSEITDYYNPTNYLGDYYVGQEIGEIWGLTTLGLFETDEEAQSSPLMTTSLDRNFAGAGDLKFAELNDDGVISRSAWTLDDPGDFRKIGNTTPRYKFGISLNTSWNGFDVNAFFNGVGKRDVYPGAEATSFWGPYNRRYQILPQHIAEDRWTLDNPDAYFPRPKGYIASGSNSLATPQTRYLQDASYIRLKNLTIGYTLPKKLTRTIKMEKLRLYVSGQNLWTLTNLHETLDPEGLQKDPDANSSLVGIGTAYPIQKVYAIGLEVQF
ncbi:MAG: SusC/RagA family TonB-linked outer membrane protein, partial [Draconibacterium sp.]